MPELTLEGAPWENLTDAARNAVLAALSAGRRLTVTEVATVAGLSRHTVLREIGRTDERGQPNLAAVRTARGDFEIEPAEFARWLPGFQRYAGSKGQPGNRGGGRPRGTGRKAPYAPESRRGAGRAA